MAKRHQKKSDSGYKYLFSNKRIFFQLLTSFVDENFIKNLKISDISRVDKSFVTKEFARREADIIYKVRYQRKTAFIYVLLEVQSAPDKKIPMRLLNYLTLLCNKIMENSQRGKLKNIFPIVLYSGSKKWNVPTNVKDLFEKNIPSKYIPDFEYFLISERDVPDEKLLKLKNLIAAVFLLEKQQNEKGLRRALNEVSEFVKREKLIDAKMFALWVRNIFETNVSAASIKKLNSVTEVKSMIAVLAEKIKKDGVKEGERRGMQKGALKKAIEAARRMRRDKLPVKVIARYTGLSVAEIRKLR